MPKAITYSFCDNFLDKLIEHIEKNYIATGKDLSRLAICFGGRRPALFLKRELARRIKKNFYPPRFFTVDEFMGYAAGKKESFAGAQDLDQCYLVYQLTKKAAPHLLKNREAFSQFLPWTREILKFIDLLDLENVEDNALKNIQAQAQIGYPVPDEINRLLESLVVLRRAYHEHMLKEKKYSRGFQYRRAAQFIKEEAFDEFDCVLFCGLFYLNRTEEAVIKDLFSRGKAVLFFQGDERRWPVFERLSKSMNCAIREGEVPRTPKFSLKLYSGFDAHAQVAQVREILKTIKELEKTVIVLPHPHHMIPLLSEITSVVKDFNISMGYPLKRSSVYALFDLIFKAQLSRDGESYYAKDYLKALRHPLVKNLKLGEDPAVARTLIHKIEEILTGQEKTALSGSLFIDPKEMLKLDDLYALTQDALRVMGIDVPKRELEEILGEIHALVFHGWEGLKNFGALAQVMENFLETFLTKSSLNKYPLNLKIAARILDVIDEFKNAAFRGEEFPLSDMLKIFESKMEREIVAFAGSPLKGLQILGLFETRSLNFDHVIVFDVNEGVLPKLNIYEPLIPREVMIHLNLDRLEQEEEIQRYQFMRLISSAKTVHLVYEESKNAEKSRFVEELIWEEEKKANERGAVEIFQPSFHVRVAAHKREVQKTPEMIEFLKKYTYSASSLNLYLRNPLEFYYRHVLGLQEREDLLDEPENRQVGTFVHQLLEETFKKFLGKKPVIDEKFRKFFQKVLDERFAQSFERSMKSEAFLLKSVLDERLKRFLENEAGNPERQVKEILFIEKPFEDKISLSCGEMKFVYKLDRVDRMEDGSIVILDYKTGAVGPMPAGVDILENMTLSRETITENIKSFQIPLYFYYLDQSFKEENIRAAFYNLRTLQLDFFPGEERQEERGRIKAAFLKALDYIMCEILNAEIPFRDEPTGA